MRRLRQWWPVIAAVIFLCVVALGFGALYLALTFDSQLFEGTWQRVGGSGSTMTVIYEGKQCSLRFDDEDSGATLTVPAVVGRRVTIYAVLPPSTDPELLGGQDIGVEPMPITVAGGSRPGHDSLVVSADLRSDYERKVLWTYESAGSFLFSTQSWVAQTVLVCAFLVVASLLFGSRSEVKSGRDKARMVVVVLVGFVLIYSILSQSDLALHSVLVLIAACWALFLATVVPAQVPTVGEGLGVIFMRSRRRAFREGLDSQDDQVERGSAMDRVLGEAIADRGDRDEVEGDDAHA